VLEFDGKDNFNQGAPERKPWFDCSCCPSNISRFIPAVPNYIYAQSANEIYANLFVASKTKIQLDKKEFTIEQETKYPWEGNVKFSITSSNPIDFILKIRIPGWAKNQPVPSDLYSYVNASEKEIRLFVNNEKQELNEIDGYLTLDRNWKTGDFVELVIPMPVQKVIPNKNVKEIAGKVAIERGPIVYCAEQVDNQGGVLGKNISSNLEFKPAFVANELQGIVKLVSADNFTMVPYYAWSHRGVGQMEVWFNLEK
jgi:hypothetical protein